MTHPWYAFYPKDYRDKTGGLTMIQDGAYRRLMDHYYITGEPLEANASVLLRICCAFDEAEQAAVLFVLEKFFVLGDDGWHHLRIDEEIVRRAEITAKRITAGKHGGKARKANAKQVQSKSYGKSVANGKQKPSQSHTQSQSNIDPDFLAFWDTCPKKTDKPQAERAWKQARKLAPAETIIAGMRVYAAQVAKDRTEDRFIKTPAPWLNGRRWEHHAPPPPEFQNTDERGWKDRLRVWRSQGTWPPNWGPKPSEPGCKCPSELLQQDAA